MTEFPDSAEMAAVPLDHPVTAGKVQYARALRGCHAAAATAQLMASGRFDDVAFSELSQLNLAAWRRAFDLRDAWLANWGAWWRYSSHAKGVNTASKVAERQANIMAQMTQLLGDQITDFISLQENIEVNYAYWVSQKLQRDPE